MVVDENVFFVYKKKNKTKASVNKILRLLSVSQETRPVAI